jgi:mono/diheme cytochrome c family protein
MKFGLGIIIGVVLGLFIAGLIGYVAIMDGWVPARADEPSSKFEEWAAHHALKAVLKRDATATNPLPSDEDNLMAGAKLYADNCSGCHGAPKNPSPAFAGGFSPGPTLFATDTVTDDPEGFTFFKIQHGIRFTGMPAFATMLKEKEIWQLTAFLKHMDKLPPKVSSYWKDMK